jgi:FMN phosphatase YigB (HAD superfamily)
MATAAVLFDLDGTLLDIDGEAFLDAYVEALTAFWQPADSEAFRHAVMAAAVPIFAAHPNETNGRVFRQHLARHVGSRAGEVESRIRQFHRTALANLAFPFRRVPGARVCVERCLRLGLRVAVATTPIYTPDVIALRLDWAGLADVPWHLITHSEVMHACKPHAAYYAEAAALLGAEPERCVMVGDDPLQDGPAAKTGMHTLLRAAAGSSGWQNLAEVAAALEAGCR